jgi:hypothetical protein
MLLQIRHGDFKIETALENNELLDLLGLRSSHRSLPRYRANFGIRALAQIAFSD